jgi:hypothetical protein
VQDFDNVMRSYYFLKDKGIKIVFGPADMPPWAGYLFISKALTR